MVSPDYSDIRPPNENPESWLRHVTLTGSENHLTITIVLMNYRKVVA